MRSALALVVSLALAVLAACSSTGTESEGPVTGVKTADNHGYHGTWLDEPFAASDVTLQKAAGGTLRLSEPGTPLRLVFFGYTSCPDICQVVMSTMASAVTRLDDEQKEDVQGVFVTTDPARDTPAALREYLDHFDPSFVGATGSLAEVVEVAKAFHIFVAKGKKLPSGGYEVDHGTYVIAVQDGRGQLVWNDSVSPADMAADIERLLEDA